MSEEKEKITISKETQREMLKFFLETSIPRIKREKEKELEKQKEKESPIKNKK